ncbi:hypothetical protein [Actinomadura rupiterrae]|uniref:hypothetical protein n=1 Tax=Actinomadura rupiterrae TaxID=559627 RepID=UPI0020A4EA98|nr:hypothetical protein [Actinomadura rupiterrae]MCP2342966.1 hypothetical protein [Actinomadura rupiterrae]
MTFDVPRSTDVAGGGETAPAERALRLVGTEIRALMILAAALQDSDQLAAKVIRVPGRRPHLQVVNRNCNQINEDVRVSVDLTFYEWSWGEPIVVTNQPESAAAAIVKVLAAEGTSSP